MLKHSLTELEYRFDILCILENLMLKLKKSLLKKSILVIISIVLNIFAACLILCSHSDSCEK